MIYFKNNYVAILTILIISFGYSIIFYQHITIDPLLKRDDIDLIKPLFQVQNFQDYISFHSKNIVKDAQPVRDLSFLINIFIKKHFDLSTFHLTNMFFTIILTFIFNRLLVQLRFSALFTGIVTIIFAFHPILTSSIGWVSARKHTLSIIFCLLAIKQFYKYNQVTKKSLLFFLLSIFSHPITILLPIWTLVLRKTNIIKKLGLKFYLLCGVSLLGFFINYLKVISLGHGNTVNIASRSISSTISSSVLSFGRSISLIFTPMNFGATYYEGHIQNLIGLLLLGIIILIYRKLVKKEDIAIWCSLLLITNITYFHIFVHDTYLYLALISQFVIISKIIFNIKNEKVKNIILIVSLFIILPTFVYQTNYTSKMWLNNLILWQRSYEHERSPHTQLVLGSKIIDDNQLLGYEFIKNGSLDFNFIENYALLKMYLFAVYNSNEVPIQSRIELLQTQINKGLSNVTAFRIFYSLTLIKGTESQAKVGFTVIKELLDGDLIKEDAILQEMKEELTLYCRNEKSPYKKYCHEIQKGLI